MKISFFYLLILLLCTACLTKQPEQVPISEEALEKLLLDVHVAEAALSALQIGNSKDSLANLYYDQISRIHGIDREVLDSTLTILQRNPELTQEIYEKMLETMEKKSLGK